ncbi:hypothetical protein [Kurthia sibirica]|nr:hypothetical protein [Kurthia sibirica]GEK35699.1 hypothetical protein KSI01_32320 [Kurthia sibirica]
MTTENKRSTLSGKGVEVYLEGAYTRVKANGTLGVNVIPRKRRDINPDAPYAGSYIRTVAFELLLTKVRRFLGTEHTYERMSLLTAVSLIN